MCKRYWFICPAAKKGLCDNPGNRKVPVPGLPDEYTKITAYFDRCAANIASRSDFLCRGLGHYVTQELVAPVNPYSRMYPYCDECEQQTVYKPHTLPTEGVDGQSARQDIIRTALEANFRDWARQEEEDRVPVTPANTNVSSNNASQTQVQLGLGQATNGQAAIQQQPTLPQPAPLPQTLSLPAHPLPVYPQPHHPFPIHPQPIDDDPIEPDPIRPQPTHPPLTQPQQSRGQQSRGQQSRGQQSHGQQSHRQRSHGHQSQAQSFQPQPTHVRPPQGRPTQGRPTQAQPPHGRQRRQGRGHGNNNEADRSSSCCSSCSVQ